MEHTQKARQLPVPAIGTAVQTLPKSARPAIGLVSPPAAGLKARQLFLEAKKASLEHISALQSAMTVVQSLLDDVVEGREVYSPGLSEFAARLSEELFWKAKTLASLAQKQRLQIEGSLRD
jgi:hypothetical protein